jgi:hypothetical protein
MDSIMGTRMRGVRAIAGMAGAQAAAADLLRARQGAQDHGVEVDEAELDAARQIFAAAEKYYKARRTYQEGYPALERFQSEFHDRLTEFLGTYEELTVGVGAEGVTQQGELAYQAERVEHSMWFPLYRDGIRELTFSDGVTFDEVRRFFGMLAQLGTAINADDDDGDGEDDAVTLLWDLELDNIGYVAVDTFSEGAGADPAARARMQRVREMVTVSMMKDLARVHQTEGGEVVEVAKRMKSIALGEADLTFLEHENFGALDEIPVRIKEARGDLYSIDQDDAASIAQRIGLDPQTGEKFLEAVIRSLAADGSPAETAVMCARIERYFDQLVGERRYERAIGLRRHITGAIAEADDQVSPELLAQVDRALSSKTAMRALIEALNATSNALEEDQILALIGLLPVNAADHLVGLMANISAGNRRRRLCDALARWGGAALHAAERALPQSAEEHALDMLYLLRQVGSELALAVLEQATRNPIARVRAEAARLYLLSAPGEPAVPHARRALRDRDPLVRRVGLQYLARHRPAGAAGWVKSMIRAEEFSELDIGEKRRLFVAYAQIAGAEAGSELMDRLGQRNLLGKKSVDQERIAAAEVLGQLRCRDAAELLDKVARGRMTRNEVKDACREALAALRRPPDPAFLDPVGLDGEGQDAPAEALAGVVGPRAVESAAMLEAPPMPEPEPVWGYDPFVPGGLQSPDLAIDRTDPVAGGSSGTVPAIHAGPRADFSAEDLGVVVDRPAPAAPGSVSASARTAVSLPRAEAGVGFHVNTTRTAESVFAEPPGRGAASGSRTDAARARTAGGADAPRPAQEPRTESPPGQDAAPSFAAVPPRPAAAPRPDAVPSSQPTRPMVAPAGAARWKNHPALAAADDRPVRRVTRRAPPKPEGGSDG